MPPRMVSYGVAIKHTYCSTLITLLGSDSLTPVVSVAVHQINHAVGTEKQGREKLTESGAPGKITGRHSSAGTEHLPK